MPLLPTRPPFPAIASLLVLAACQGPPAGTTEPTTDTDPRADTDTDTVPVEDADVGEIVVGSPDRRCRVEPTGILACVGARAGDGTVGPALLPSRVVGLDDVVVGAASSGHTCAVREDGAVACWGLGDHLALGGAVEPGDEALVPVDVPGVVDAVAVSAGAQHTCALGGDGGVACWGDPGALAVGDQAGWPEGSVVPVSALPAAVSVSAGLDVTCVALSDGTARCWGGNAAGQLGDGTTTPSAAPVTVHGVDDAVAVAAGWSHACALRADGGVACWGDDGSGLWSPGETGAILALEDAVDLDAGDAYTCALRRDGTAACWGEGAGVAEVSGVDQAIRLSVEETTACVVRVDGEARCWTKADPTPTVLPRAPELAEPVDTCVDDACEAWAWPVTAPRLVVRDEVVTNRVNGLVWQRTAPDGVHPYEEAAAYCDALELDGRADWRLPTRHELLSLIDYAAADVFDDVAFIAGRDNATDSTGPWFWTRSPGALEGWYDRVGTEVGLPVNGYPSTPGAVRCVRAPEPRDLAGRYEVADDVVADTLTGLGWERDPPAIDTDQGTASARCAALSAGGFDDWRLPAFPELLSIFDGRWSPAVDPSAFGADADAWYWTDTSWSAHFGDGSARSYDIVTLDKRSRCVR